jgi:uncharacterized protein YndB with AHSA1/START domain
MTKRPDDPGTFPLSRGSGTALKRPMRDCSAQGQGETFRMADQSPQRRGNLTFDGDYATLTFERRLRHPIQAVWEAITDPDHLARWYLTKAQIDARVGGSIDFVHSPALVHATGKILTWEPPRVFEHEWNVGPKKEIPTQGERSTIRWELTSEGDITILRFTHRRLTRQTAVIFAGGMVAFLDRLENQLDGVPLVDWVARVEKIRAHHPEWGP